MSGQIVPKCGCKDREGAITIASEFWYVVLETAEDERVKRNGDVEDDVDPEDTRELRYTM